MILYQCDKSAHTHIHTQYYDQQKSRQYTVARKPPRSIYTAEAVGIKRELHPIDIILLFSRHFHRDTDIEQVVNYNQMTH